MAEEQYDPTKHRRVEFVMAETAERQAVALERIADILGATIDNIDWCRRHLGDN